jgi:hypothetical protein
LSRSGDPTEVAASGLRLFERLLGNAHGHCIASAAFILDEQRILTFTQRLGNLEINAPAIGTLHWQTHRADPQRLMRQKCQSVNVRLVTRDELQWGAT